MGGRYAPKTRLEDLAIYGAHPAFDDDLHVGGPNIGDRATFLERVNEILDNRWLTNNGRYVQQFEQQIADLVGVRHCVAMCNATSALEITIRALQLSGEVIVPSFTFVATAHALQWQGITPVFVDIDPSTHNLDPARIEQLITPRTTGILGVHLWGRACNPRALAEIAANRGLKLLFDAAHAFGCSHEGRMVGCFGDAEVFSFHATKILNSFEGGAVATNNDLLADQIRLMRNFGFTGYDNVTQLGLNGKMTEVCAAMGVTSLEAMSEIVKVNERNYKAYRDGLAGLQEASLIKYDPAERNNYHYVVIEIDPTAPLDRDELLTVLHKENVLVRRYFWPGCHRMAPYNSLYPNTSAALSQTERVASRVMILPTGQAVTPKIVGIICSLIRCAFDNASKIRRLLETHPADVC